MKPVAMTHSSIRRVKLQNQTYKFKAHPTKYNDVWFRSRLEATWAAFFDIMQIEWVYEKFDLEGWSPDFQISCRKQTYSVEVKPATLISDGHDEAQDQVELRKWFSKCADAALCLGLGPSGTTNGQTSKVGNILGYQKFIGCDFYEKKELYFPLAYYQPGTLSLVSGFKRHEPVNLFQIWKQAKNKTQWKPVEHKVSKQSSFEIVPGGFKYDETNRHRITQ